MEQLNELHDQGRNVRRVLETVNVRDVRMVERGEHLRFAAEPGETVRIVRDGREQDFDRDVPVQLRIARPIDFAHPAHTEQGDDFVRAEARAGSESRRRQDWRNLSAAGLESAD